MTTKMTMAEIKQRPSTRDHAKIAATSEADIRRHMIEDGQDPDEELLESDVISP